MPKAIKKTVKKTTKKVAPVESIDMSMVPSPVPTVAKKPVSGKTLTFALAVVVIGLVTYKVGPWLVPAVVDNRPVSRFELWTRMEKIYGAKTLDDMVNEKIFDKAVAKAGVKVDQTRLDTEIKTLETQYESAGGLDEILKQQGMTRKDLIKDVSTRLAMEELLADKIAPSDEEVKKQFDAGAVTLYKDKKFEDVKASIADELKQTKLRDAFLVWFADVKKEAKVKTFGL